MTRLYHGPPESKLTTHLMETTGPALAGVTASGTNEVKPIYLGGGLSIADSILNVVGAGSAGGLEWRNKITNGNFEIDQWLNGASGSLASATSGYAPDRWFISNNTDGTVSRQQLGTTPPPGLNTYIRIACTVADTTIAAGQYCYFSHIMEGLRVMDLDFGLATASYVTLTFQIKSNLTGNFSGAIINSAQNRAYSFNVTVNVASTWETKTIVIPGDTSGTWLRFSTGIGIRLWFGLALGTTFQTAPGVWTAGNYIGSTGQTLNLMSSTSNFVEFSDFRFEAGTIQTASRLPYDFQFYMCRRFATRINDVPGAAGVYPIGVRTQSILDCHYPLRSPMRIGPALANNNLTSWVATSPGAGQMGFFGHAPAAWTTIVGTPTLSLAQSGPEGVLVRVTPSTSFSGTNGDTGYFALGSATTMLSAEH